ncbi:hypothetical protein ACLQ2R_30540 [Streptosporangium sp. DT93]
MTYLEQHVEVAVVRREDDAAVGVVDPNRWQPFVGALIFSRWMPV